MKKKRKRSRKTRYNKGGRPVSVLPIDLKVSTGFSVSKKIGIGFEETCIEQGLNKSHVIENFMNNYIQDHNNSKI